VNPRDFTGFSSVRVLDGGLATELERRGCDISGPLWSAHILDQAPEVIAAVHLDFLRAGADCIATASYQVSAQGNRAIGRDGGEADRALRMSVAIAEQARADYAGEASRPVWIVASLGPYGAVLHNGAEYHGRYAIDFDRLVRFHAERLAVLADTHADLAAFETIPSLEEARAILLALQQVPSLTAWVSFTCCDSAHVAHGEPLRACAQALRESRQVVAVGINCTAPQLIPPLIVEARTGMGDHKPVIVYPNSGETWDLQTHSWRGHSDPAAFGDAARTWIAAGAQAVGGCCRTGPAHITAVAEALRSSPPDAPS
jgi:homocysteine S-methyltransferase